MIPIISTVRRLGTAVTAMTFAAALCACTAETMSSSSEPIISSVASPSSESFSSSSPISSSNPSSSSLASSSSSSSSSSVLSTAPRSVAANDPALRYIGRVAITANATTMDWANSQIQFRLEAPAVELRFDDGKNNYNVFVDGELASVIVTEQGARSYPLTLTQGSHTILVTKRTGPNFGSGKFLGLELPQGGQLLDLPAPPARKIEFIGDSYTVGYGNEGPALDCGGLYRPYENSYYSFAPIAARALQAESHSIAISGFGAVRNYGAANTTSPDPVPFYYNRTIMSDGSKLWNFNSWMPDAVVIKLGTNDYSTEPSPPASVFIEGIHGLIQQVNDAYGQLPIFLMADDARAPVIANLKSAVQQQQSMGNDQVRYVQVTHPPQSQLGCDWHPLIEAHQTMANELVSKIKPILGW